MCYIFYRAETDANVFDFVRRYTADYTVVSRRFVKFSVIILLRNIFDQSYTKLLYTNIYVFNLILLASRSNIM